MHSSVAIPGTIEFLNITEINPLISKCKIKVCYVGDEPNRNRSIITESVARKIAQSLPGSPIVGYFNDGSKDFEGHNEFFSFKNGELIVTSNTRPYGFVDINARVWFEEYLDDNTNRRKYMVTEGYLWTGQYPEAESMLNGSGQPQSLKFEDKHYLDAFWTKDDNGFNQFFIVNEAVIENLCILGKDVEPCFEGSSITSFSLDADFKNTMFNLIQEMKNILEGGIVMSEEVKNVEEVVEEPAIVETPEVIEETTVEEVVVEEPTEEVEESITEEEVVEETPSTDSTAENESAPATYSLEEIPEYVALRTEFEALQTRYSALETQTSELLAFKNTVETQEKEKLIQSFYMLSAEDKQDVVDNISTYSYDEIKSKLSVICVDKRVSFAEAKEDETTTDVVTYNLNDANTTNNEAEMPAWLKSVDNHIKNR